MRLARQDVESPGSEQEVSGRRNEHPCVRAFEREFDYLARTLRRLGAAPHDVEDLAHEVFLVLYQGWDKYDPERPLRAYLFGIAFRIVSSHRRKQRREVVGAVDEAKDEALGPDGVLEAKQARALVLKALERIPLERRAVLVMHDIDGTQMKEIANALSIYRFTGYSRLRKARQEFAAAIRSLSRRGES